MDSEVSEAVVEIDQYRGRRERELASLYSIARSLTALGEVNEVLTSVVRHAHELMGVDLTYLSVFEGEELRLRAVEGAVSPRFRTARVGSTTGIGGKVIENRAPFWVSNYLTATGIEHSAAFDEMVTEEGLVALLGVPLRAHDRILGVLYVAKRVEHPYSPDEVSLLSAFADHASVALENARLYEESRAALSDLRSAYATIERSGQVHEALTKIVLTGGGESEVAALLTEALGGRVTVVNRFGDLITSRTDADEPNPPTEPAWQDALEESRSSGRAVTGCDSGGRWHTVSSIAAGQTYLGAVVWTTHAEPTEVDIRTVERASHVVGLLTLKQDAVVQAEERLRGEILTDLMRSPLPLRSELVARGRAMRLELGTFNAVLVVDVGKDRSREVLRRTHALSRDWSGLAGEHLGRVTLVFRSDDLELASRSIHRELSIRLAKPVLVCAAPVDDQLGGFGRAFALASRCTQVLTLTGVGDLGTTTTENGMYAVLFDTDRGDDLDGFLESTLGRLHRYDDKNKTDLIPTLHTYFANAGNVAKTARELHVHTNTLLKRLERVTSVLGPNWNSPDRALALQLALRLEGLRGAMES
jgi:hypothetical protein